MLLEAIYATTLGASVAVNAWTTRVTKNPGAVPPAALSAPWFVHAPTVAVSIVYFGVLSPAPILSIMVVSFAGATMPLRRAVLLYLSMTIPQFGFGLAIALGQVADPGIITGTNLSAPLLFLAFGLIQLVHFIVFILARATHPERTLRDFEIGVSS
jgi:hypothetical protein